MGAKFPLGTDPESGSACPKKREWGKLYLFYPSVSIALSRFILAAWNNDSFLPGLQRFTPPLMKSAVRTPKLATFPWARKTHQTGQRRRQGSNLGMVGRRFQPSLLLQLRALSGRTVHAFFFGGGCSSLPGSFSLYIGRQWHEALSQEPALHLPLSLFCLEQWGLETSFRFLAERIFSLNRTLSTRVPTQKSHARGGKYWKREPERLKRGHPKIQHIYLAEEIFIFGLRKVRCWTKQRSRWTPGYTHSKKGGRTSTKTTDTR